MINLCSLFPKCWINFCWFLGIILRHTIKGATHKGISVPWELILTKTTKTFHQFHQPILGSVFLDNKIKILKQL